jgi:hypothetical protein
MCDVPVVSMINQLCSTTVTHSFGSKNHITYAQDELKRDVVIKIINANSHEEHIYDLILCQLQLFKGVLPTIEIIQSPHTFTFVVMPQCVMYILMFLH